MTTSLWNGAISSQNSRLEVKWNPNPYWDQTANTPEFIIPGKTYQSQWFVEPGSITLYNNNSKPWKNMQTITFNCEFDSTTNLAPGGAYDGTQNLGGSFDQNQAAGTDPQLLTYGVSGYSGYSGAPQKFTATIPATGTTITAATNLYYDSPYGTLSSDTPTYPSHYKLYVLHVFTPGKNQGSYLISNHTNGSDTITILENGGITGSVLNGAFAEAQTGVQCGVELFEHYLPVDASGVSGWAANHPDIQTDLQTNPGVFTLTATLHTWATGMGDDVLHMFSIVPYFLLQSKLLKNTIVPTWSFTCKCIVREVDMYPGISGVSGLVGKFTNLWE